MTQRDEYIKTIVDGDILENGYHNNNFLKNKTWTVCKYMAEHQGLVAFSSVIWQTSTLKTADAGATWAAGGPGAGYDLIRRSVATASKAIAATTAGAIKFTTDSGATWTASSTQPANITDCYCIHFITDTVAVMGGDADATNSSWYSTDGGDNWSQSTSGTVVHVNSIVMYSATTGFFLSGAGAGIQKIYKTTDGGDNWADTTHNTLSVNERPRMVALSSTTFSFLSMDSQVGVHYYGGSGDSTKIINIAEGTADIGSDIILSDNGSYYFIFYNNELGNQLYRISDMTGSDYEMKPIGSQKLSGGFDAEGQNSIVKFDTNKFLFLNAGGTSIIEEIDT